MQATDDTKKKHSWSWKDGKMNCCTSETSTCNVSKLWEVGGAAQFHDATLQRATKEINAILDGVRKRNRDHGRDLNFVQVGDRHLLAWIAKGIVGPDDDEAVVRKALKVKVETSRTPQRPIAAKRRRQTSGGSR